MDNFSYYIPTKILFGIGTINELATIDLPGAKPLIVTGGSSIRRQGILETVENALKARSVEPVVFDGVVPNPTRRNVIDAVALAKKHACDFVIGLGGGSSVDTAKAVAMMLANDGDLWDYVQVGKGGRNSFQRASLPLIAIPTTAGTGTEGNPTAVITNEDTGEKVGIRCEFPLISLVDPALTQNITPRYTAFQGFDALFHCIEAFISKKASPISDLLALEGIRLIFANLPEAVNNGQNLEARSAVSWGATLGGIVICLASCTTAHNIEHSLSGIDPTVIHGEGLILISKAFHAYGAAQVPELYAKMAEVIGAASPKQTVQKKAQAFLDAMEALKIACGVNGLNLSDHGFTDADIEQIASGSHVIAGGAFSRDRYEISDAVLAQMLRDSMK